MLFVLMTTSTCVRSWGIGNNITFLGLWGAISGFVQVTSVGVSFSDVVQGLRNCSQQGGAVTKASPGDSHFRW